MEREKSSVRSCRLCCAFVPFTLVHYDERGQTLHLCQACSEREGINSEMIALADLIGDIKGERQNIGGFEFVVSEDVPPGDIYLIPSRESLERAREHDERPDLRRYFGRIKNVRH